MINQDRETAHMRTNYTSGLALEEQIGYSRAVRVGSTLYTSPTAPVNDELAVQGEDGAQQAEFVLARLKATLKGAEFTFNDVVAVTIYVVDDPRASNVYDTYSSHFAAIKPTISVVNVVPWKNPDMLLEIALIAHKEGRVQSA